MNKAIFVFVAAATTLGSIGCAERVAPTAKAASVEQRRCNGPQAAAEDLRLLQSTAVLGARPLYSHVITGKNDTEERVTGAQLEVRPPEGVSPERLTRALQCHSAQVLLGQVDPSSLAADDPYWLPEAWLDIQVKPGDGNQVVVLRADSVPDGLKVLHRATAFAESHGTPSTQIP